MTNSMIIGYLFALLGVCAGGLITFDRLVYLQRRDYPQQWELDGKPWHGFGASGWAAWQRCSFTWLVSTATWMRKDRGAFRLLLAYRGLVLAFIVGLLGGIIYRVS